MATVTESEIKDALAARDNARSRENEHLLHARLAERARIRSAAEKLLIPYWKQTGLDIEAFRRIQEQAKSEMRRVAEREKEQIIRSSTSVTAKLRQGEKRWVGTVNSFPKADGPLAANFIPPVFNVIDTPSMIEATSHLEITQSHIEPENNWAKVKGKWPVKTDPEELRFVFMWSNPNNRYSVVNVASFLALSGSCEADADGGFAGIFPGSEFNMVLVAVMDFLPLWNPPTVGGLPSPGIQILVPPLHADGGGWFESVGDIEIRSVSGTFGDLRVNQLVVPPNGAAAFMVTLRAFAYFDGNDSFGDTSLGIDFSSGGFEVKCPLVAVAVLS
jgi:hypothetical protein